MKYLLTLALFIATNAFAHEVCSYEETYEFFDAIEARGLKPIKTSKNHKRFTFVEKQMIHLTVTQQDYLAGSTKEESLEIFGDYYNGSQGSNAGLIKYYEVDGQKLAYVHYFPGDNEYGAFFEISNNGSFKLFASVNDGGIICKE